MRPDDGYSIHVKFSRTDAWFAPLVHDGDSIAEVKQELWRQALIHPAAQELVFGGRVLRDYRTVRRCGITAEACVLLNPRKANIGDFVGQDALAEAVARTADLRFARACMRPQATIATIRCGFATPAAGGPVGAAMAIPGKAAAPSMEPLPVLWCD
jgi:hypothetical protein